MCSVEVGECFKLYFQGIPCLLPFSLMCFQSSRIKDCFGDLLCCVSRPENVQGERVPHPSSCCWSGCKKVKGETPTKSSRNNLPGPSLALPKRTLRLWIGKGPDTTSLEFFESLTVFPFFWRKVFNSFPASALTSLLGSYYYTVYGAVMCDSLFKLNQALGFLHPSLI